MHWLWLRLGCAGAGLIRCHRGRRLSVAERQALNSLADKVQRLRVCRALLTAVGRVYHRLGCVRARGAQHTTWHDAESGRNPVVWYNYIPREDI